MAGKLDEKVAVITGGASGIGRATVLRFLAEGARVVAADLNETTAQEMLRLAADAGHGERVRFIKTDVAQEKDVEATIALATSAFGRLDCVFNNAGLGGALGPITDIRVEDWDFTFAVLTRKVRMYLAEKGLTVPLQPVNLLAGEQSSSLHRPGANASGFRRRCALCGSDRRTGRRAAPDDEYRGLHT